MQTFWYHKFSLSYLSIVLYAPISFFSYLLASLNLDSPPAQILAQALLLTFAIEIILIFLTKWQLSHLSKVSRPTLVIIFAPIALIGIVRGLIVSSLLNFSDSTFQESLYSRLPVSVIATFLWLGLLTYLINNSRSYNKTYSLLFSKAVLQALDPDPLVNKININEIPELLDFKEKLNTLLDFDKVEKNEVERIYLAAATIKAHIELVLRPLSHRLWIPNDFQVPRSRFWRLLGDAARNLNFSLVRVLLPWSLLFFFGAIPYFPANDSLVVSLAFMSVISIPLLIIRFLIFLRLQGELLLLLLFSLYIMTPVPLTNSTLNLFSFEYQLGNTLLIHLLTAITGVSFVLVNSVSRLINADRSRILDSIPEALSLLAERKYVASYLHNSMQSQLTSIALQLEKAHHGGVSTEVRGALERLGSLINREMSINLLGSDNSLETRLVILADSWRGICAVDFQGFSNLELTTDEMNSASFFIEEVINNSVRHGGANQIEFTMEGYPNAFHLGVSHNGRNPIVEGSGLGKAWLDEYAAHNWKISHVNGRTTLVAVIDRVI